MNSLLNSQLMPYLAKGLILMGFSFSSFSVSAENWICRISDDVRVCKLSIPGTHDTGTGSGFPAGSLLIGNAYARTQDVDIRKQWETGIRAFDLRPCVKADTLNINHGIVRTNLGFSQALRVIRDSLIANPSEFAIIHMLHETDGDSNSSKWSGLILNTFESDEFKDYLVDFKPNLTVGEMRGKILIISRSNYATKPIGGYFSNWSQGTDLTSMTSGSIVGSSKTARMYNQDYSDTSNAGGINTKVTAITNILSRSANLSSASTTWVFNFASAYSLTYKLGSNNISLSDGYRDNATHTNKAIIDYITDETHKMGPTGIIIMDYAGVDESQGQQTGTIYQVRGLELTKALIEHNFKYLNDATAIDNIEHSDESIHIEDSFIKAKGIIEVYTADGTLFAKGFDCIRLPQKKGMYIVRSANKSLKIMQ